VARCLADCDALIEARAVRLVRIHLAGRTEIPDRAKRNKHNRQHDRAFDLLIAAVEERDRAFEAHEKRMEQWRKRSAAATKGRRARNARALVAELINDNVRREGSK
jgi:hypothetical protein